MTVKDLSVAHFGHYPPVMGGVSTHVRRLHRRILTAGGQSHVFAQPAWQGPATERVTPMRVWKRPLCYVSSLLRPGHPIDESVIHCHDSWAHLAPCLLRWILRGKKLVVTVHNQRDQEIWRSLGPIQRSASLLLLQRRDIRWIAVSEVVRKQLMARGVLNDHCRVIPAYLAPEANSATAVLPLPIQQFAATHRPMLSVYGFRFWIEGGIDVYGFDMCVEAMVEIVKHHPQAGLVIFTPEIRMNDYHQELIRRAKQAGILNHLHFHSSPMDEGYPLWQASDVYLRPSNTDGDAVAIREALSLRVPVVASDAAPRPAGVRVFRNRDTAAFIRETLQALNNNAAIRQELAQLANPDRFDEIVAVYAEVLATG